MCPALAVLTRSHNPYIYVLTLYENMPHSYFHEELHHSSLSEDKTDNFPEDTGTLHVLGGVQGTVLDKGRRCPHSQYENTLP